jgi:N-acetylmuramoyl-L-alanine amidase
MRHHPVATFRGAARIAALSCLLLLPAFARADETVALRYSYRDDAGCAEVFRDLKGGRYVSLVDVARFYGVRVSFVPTTGRVTLTKGERQVHFALHQEFFLLGETREAYPMDPAELVGGQLGLTADSVRDILGFILNISIRQTADGKGIVAGGVNREEVRQEILAALATPGTVAKAGPDRLASIPAATPMPTRRVERLSIVPDDRDRVYRVRKIVIDAGHGGHDGGAKGASGRYLEKDMTLDVAKRVAEYLADEPGFVVLMTRKKDVYLSLKDRTDFANRSNGDLFISIHGNANPNRRATGSEIYVYSSRASGRVASIAARRENMESNWMEFTMDDLLHSAYRIRSFALAEEVEKRIRGRMGQRIRRTEQAPFYVLAKVQMPSILVETAFISNAEEERKLRDPEWRARMSRAIADGILAYRDRIEDSLDARRAERRNP